MPTLPLTLSVGSVSYLILLSLRKIKLNLHRSTSHIALNMLLGSVKLRNVYTTLRYKRKKILLPSTFFLRSTQAANFIFAGSYLDKPDTASTGSIPQPVVDNPTGSGQLLLFLFHRLHGVHEFLPSKMCTTYSASTVQ